LDICQVLSYEGFCGEIITFDNSAIRCKFAFVMRILIVQTAFIGDCVLTTPLISAVRGLFPRPNNEIAMLISPLGKGIFENNPHIDELFIYDKRSSEKGFGAFRSLASHLRKFHFDLAILPHRSFRTGLLCKMAGIKQRLGFSKSAGALFYSDKVLRNNMLHEAKRLLQLAKYFGEIPDSIPLELFPSDTDSLAAEQFLVSHSINPEKTLIIAPGSVWATKRYPPDSYARVIQILLGDGHFEKAVIIGGDEDRAIADQILEYNCSRAISAIGMGNIMASAALIGKCKALIGNDSAPVHIAAAMKTPVVAIFGPTVKDFGFTPYFDISVVVEPDCDLKCRPCSGHGKAKCASHECMRSIPPQKVADAVIKLLHKKKSATIAALHE